MGATGRRLLRVAAPVLGAIVLVVAVFALRRELERTPPHEIVAALRAMAPETLAWAALLTVASYGTLTLYDRLALQTIGCRLPYASVVLVSFIGYVLSHNLGFAGAVGDAARLRLYGRRGLSAVEVAKVILFAALTFWLGFALLGGAAFLVYPEHLSPGLPFPRWVLRALGAGLLGAVVVYLALAVRGQGAVRLRGVRVDLPGPRTAGLELALSTADWIVSASVLYALLPQLSGVDFEAYMAVFFVAQCGGLLSHVPGGLGVFEGLVLSLLHGAASVPDLLGALVAWRAIYFLAPLALAGLLFMVDEIRARRGRAAHESP